MMREAEALPLVKRLKTNVQLRLYIYRPNLHFVIDSAGDRTFEVHWSPKTSKKNTMNHG